VAVAGRVGSSGVPVEDSVGDAGPQGRFAYLCPPLGPRVGHQCATS